VATVTSLWLLLLLPRPDASAEIEREEFKVTLSLKKSAKEGDLASAKILARSLIDSKKARNRMHATKTQIHSVQMNIQNQLGMGHMHRGEVLGGGGLNVPPPTYTTV